MSGCRVRYQITGTEPINFKFESAKLVELIKSYDSKDDGGGLFVS